MSHSPAGQDEEGRVFDHLYTYADLGVRGMQTVARSQGLADEPLRDILRRLDLECPESYGLARNNVPLSYRGFRVGSQHYCLSRLEYVGLDLLGRPGNYLAHSTLMSTRDLARAANDVLAVARENPWIAIAEVNRPLSDRRLDLGALVRQELLPPESTGEDLSKSAVILDCLLHGGGKSSVFVLGALQDAPALTRRVLCLLPPQYRLDFPFCTLSFSISQGPFRLTFVPEATDLPRDQRNIVTLRAVDLESGTLELQTPWCAFIRDCGNAGRLDLIEECLTFAREQSAQIRPGHLEALAEYGSRMARLPAAGGQEVLYEEALARLSSLSITPWIAARVASRLTSAIGGAQDSEVVLRLLKAGLDCLAGQACGRERSELVRAAHETLLRRPRLEPLLKFLACVKEKSPGDTEAAVQAVLGLPSDTLRQLDRKEGSGAIALLKGVSGFVSTAAPVQADYRRWVCSIPLHAEGAEEWLQLLSDGFPLQLDPPESRELILPRLLQLPKPEQWLDRVMKLTQQPLEFLRALLPGIPQGGEALLEKAIRCWSSRSFPPNEWCRLLPQDRAILKSVLPRVLKDCYSSEETVGHSAFENLVREITDRSSLDDAWDILRPGFPKMWNMIGVLKHMSGGPPYSNLVPRLATKVRDAVLDPDAEFKKLPLAEQGKAIHELGTFLTTDESIHNLAKAYGVLKKYEDASEPKLLGDLSSAVSRLERERRDALNAKLKEQFLKDLRGRRGGLADVCDILVALGDDPKTAETLQTMVGADPLQVLPDLFRDLITQTDGRPASSFYVDLAEALLRELSLALCHRICMRTLEAFVSDRKPGELGPKWAKRMREFLRNRERNSGFFARLLHRLRKRWAGEAQKWKVLTDTEAETSAAKT